MLLLCAVRRRLSAKPVVVVCQRPGTRLAGAARSTRRLIGTRLLMAEQSLCERKTMRGSHGITLITWQAWHNMAWRCIAC